MASLVFDCGKCISCRKKRAYELACRCVLHSSLYHSNCFLTLTYDESKPGYHNNFDYSDIQKFKKRLRQHVERNFNGKKIQIFNVHEYGKKGKKHWHLILFNHDFGDKVLYSRKNGIPLFTSETLARLWPWGFNTVGDVTAASAMYTSLYIEKDLKNGNTKNSKRSHSKHSGIGREYFYAHYSNLLRLGWVPINGYKLPLPRYFQKLAHKHYAHYYEPRLFIGEGKKKARYTPFKPGVANREIADLFVQYSLNKQERIYELEQQWSEFIQDHLTNKTKPDFILSAENALYDLNKKQLGEF